MAHKTILRRLLASALLRPAGALLILIAGAPAAAQENAPAAAAWWGNHILSLGVQVGVNIGGAVPYPLKHIPEAINAYPQLTGSLGAKCTFPLYQPFSLGVELNYKTIAMKADARVENQAFKSLDGLLQYFSGTAQMNMSFTILEIPLYAKYRFSHSPHTALLGGYYAFVLAREFTTIAQKGYIGNAPDEVASPVDARPQIMPFTTSLDRWDAGLIAGYELQIIPRLHLGLRFMMGFKDIFKPQLRYFEYRMLPMRGAVTISYSLFDTPLF
ncbi:MAG: PorT family protein [Prevotellaceae bacterium]|jgi:hypothetical protein|nr:PorT family protein [Prevotellaceae bacterium]